MKYDVSRYDYTVVNRSLISGVLGRGTNEGPKANEDDGGAAVRGTSEALVLVEEVEVRVEGY